MASKASKRVRGANFSADEDIVISFVTENASVLESKSAEPNIFRRKKKLWEELSEKMRSLGYIRSPKKLRDTYFRLKQSAKIKIGRFSKAQRKTGGGEGPSGEDVPSEMDWAIHNVCPVDFKEDTSKFDSDYIKQQDIPTPSSSLLVPLPSTSRESFTGLIDPVTGEIFTNESLHDTSIPLPSAPTSPTVPILKKGKKKPKKREMSAYEEEMLKVNKKHMEARINNEKILNEKELEILDIRKKAEIIRLEILEKYLANENLKVDLDKL